MSAGRLSLIPGIAIVAGTAVGAGMFSLPVVSSGMWFGWSLLLLAFTWFCMYHSGLLILEANLNYEPGASFDTFVGDLLGPRWNAANGLTLAFVLYILSYAFISGGSSMLNHSLEQAFGQAPPQALSGLGLALVTAAVVWVSSALVGRVTGILLGGMLVTFLLSAGDLATRVNPRLLLESEPGFAVFALAAIPFYLTSFGYHGCVPSLFKLYGREPARIRRCLLAGSLASLAVYSLWNLVTMGNLGRDGFLPVIAAGGNIGDLVAALDGTATGGRLLALLTAFANLAVASSFLGCTLGLFDYVADKFGFDDSAPGRLRSLGVTFLPPVVASLIYPDGFLHAIGLAGLCACMWGTIVPALAARRSRQVFGSPHFRVWGGEWLLRLIIAYGLLLVICYTLAALGWLPRWGH